MDAFLKASCHLAESFGFADYSRKIRKKIQAHGLHQPAMGTSDSPVRIFSSTEEECQPSPKRQRDEDTSPRRAKVHECAQCKVCFPHHQSLTRHMESEHSEGFSCKHEGCSDKFTTKEYLKDHVRRVHAGEKCYTCQNCRYKTDNKQQMLNHRVKVHGVQPPKKYSCDKCKRIFVDPGNLKRHKPEKCSAEIVNQCEKCFKCFKRDGLLQKHRRKKHRIAEESYDCSTCGKGFATKKNLRQHAKVHIAQSGPVKKEEESESSDEAESDASSTE